MARPYLFQLWTETHRHVAFGRMDSIACAVADSLAYAAARDIPLTDALRDLPFCGESRFRSGIPRLLNAWPLNLLPLHPSCWARDYAASLRVKRMIEALEKGEPLSYALEAELAEYFPKYFILGVEKAENGKCLRTALPALAESLSYPQLVKRRRLAAFAPALIRMLVLLPIIAGMLVFIFPKFARIGEEYGLPATGLMRWYVPAMSLLVTVAHWCVVLGILIVLLAQIEVFREMLLLRLPLFRRDCVRIRVAQLVQSLLAFTKSGQDILTAAEWTFTATKSPWMRRKLAVFIAALREGSRWDEAWAQMAIELPLADWLVRNAAVREDPVAGFETLLDKLCFDIDQATQRWEALADPVCVVLLAIVVGATIYCVFELLIQMTVFALD